MNWLCQLFTDGAAQILQNTSLALVTIFIPIAISLFENNSDSDFRDLDRTIVLDYLVNGKRVLWELSLLFIPIFFWSLESLTVRITILIIWAYGVYLAIKKLQQVYSWIRGNRFYYRFLYLKDSPINKEAEDLWRSVWQAKEVNLQNENSFFKIFKQKINDVLTKDELTEIQITLKLIQDFETFIDKRDVLFLTSDHDVFVELLKWRYLVWDKEHSYMMDGNDTGKIISYNSLLRALDLIFKKILTRSIDHDFPYDFFKTITRHIEEHKNIKINKSGKDRYYLESFLAVFYSNFFDSISSSKQSYEIWESCFPKLLKIDLETIKEIPARITLHHYLQWAINRIRNDDEQYDFNLDNVSKELFPKVEPVFWSIMLTLLMRPWGKNRIESLMDAPHKFGNFGRMHVWSGDFDQRDPTEALEALKKDELEYSIKLLLILFKNEFSLKKIKEYIDVLSGLSYSDDPKKETYRQEVLNYMEQIKNNIETNNPQEERSI